MSSSPHREEQHAAHPPVMVRSSREEQARLAVNGSRSEPTTCLTPNTQALTPAKPPAAPRPLVADVIIECLIEEEKEQRREGVCLSYSPYLHNFADLFYPTQCGAENNQMVSNPAIVCVCLCAMNVLIFIYTLSRLFHLLLPCKANSYTLFYEILHFCTQTRTSITFLH